jgi:hypothetical protein
LELLLEVPEGRGPRIWSGGARARRCLRGGTWRKALKRAEEILGVGLGAAELPAEVPQRRLVDLARYGMGATATTPRRHGPSRQLATLLATVVYLEGKSVDDCLDLLDLR